MEEALRAFIVAMPGVPDSVDWGARPRGAPLPGVVLNLISDVGGHNQDGPNDFSEARVQVDVYAATFGEARNAGRAIRAGLDGLQDGSILGTFLEMSSVTLEEGETPDVRVYRSMQDFRVIYRLQA